MDILGANNNIKEKYNMEKGIYFVKEKGKDLVTSIYYDGEKFDSKSQDYEVVAKVPETVVKAANSGVKILNLKQILARQR